MFGVVGKMKITVVKMAGEVVRMKITVGGMVCLVLI
jgi:hypothetical protein